MSTNYNLIILFVILGAAAAALMAYAVARISGNFEPEPVQRFSEQQMAYMRDVRERNLHYLQWMVRSSKPEPGPSQLHEVRV